MYLYIYLHGYAYLTRCNCTDPIADEMCQKKFIVCYEKVTFIYTRCIYIYIYIYIYLYMRAHAEMRVCV